MNRVDLPTLLRDRRGIAPLEYGIIATVLALGFISTFGMFASSLGSIFAGVGGSL